MFKSARWRSEKNKIKVEFKLQFHAVKVPQIRGDALMISVVPADVGKPTVKSDKALVRDGGCFWENPVYETVKFSREPKSGKIQERIYYFVVGTGSSRGGVLGEASIDFSNYAEATKVYLVALPLKNSKTEAVLNVSIQRMQESIDPRDIEETENVKLSYKENSLKLQLDSGVKNNSEDVSVNKAVPHIAGLNGNRRASSGSDLTISSSDGSSGVEIPWQPQIKSGSVLQEPAGALPSLRPNSDSQPATVFEEHQRSQWDWLGNSALEGSTDGSSGTPREALLRENLDESSDVVIEKLKSELALLSRQAEMSELELQTLRKQNVKESKRGQDLFRDIACLKEERDALKEECESLKAAERRIGEAKARNSLRFEGREYKAIADELRQELNHAKELNANLRVQLQKTQESNSELILAVKDLDEMLEQNDREILNLSSGSLTKDEQKLHEAGCKHQSDNDNDDEEQKALEECMKDHGDSEEACLLEQQIMNMRTEIEVYKRDKDELEMQMEQLALDYEIMKQENHEMAYKLEQSELQEQLKMQYECSSSYANTQELEMLVENLENELKMQSKESADALAKISELEVHVKSLEEDLEEQSQGFVTDLEALMQSKVEQEQRAIRAEETLRKTRLQNANIAERIQEEFRRLSVEMASTFEANEKLATKALADGTQLCLQKIHLEEAIKKASEEHQSIKSSYEDRLFKLSGQVRSMTTQIEKMQSEIDDKTFQLEHQKKQTGETQRFLSDEILKLEDEIETFTSKNKTLSEDLASKEILMHELKQIRISIKEMELLMEQGNKERLELGNRVTSLKNDTEESQKELNKMRCLVEEKESIAGRLQSELEAIQSQYTLLEHSLSENELETEELRKQVCQLRDDLKKKEDALSSMDKKLKDEIGRVMTLDAIKTTFKEVANLKERIKLLEDEIMLNESTLEISSNIFLEKEKDLLSKIEELEQRMELLNQNSIQYEYEVEKIAALEEDQVANVGLNEEASNSHEDSTRHNNTQECCTNSSRLGDGDEMASLKERNRLMEVELKEMQERYSEISLKFAEVEGERQQLVMKVRNLKNKKKNLA